MEGWFRDFRRGARALSKRPGFTAVVAATLALGIGANAAVFSVVEAVLLRPLPYFESERLVRLWSAYPRSEIAHGTTSSIDLEDWRRSNALLDSIAGFPAFRTSGFVLTGGETPEELVTTYVTKGFFETLATPALRGRALSDEDQVEGRNQLVVLSHGAWRRRFGAAPEVVGSRLVLNGEPFIVVGVMPPGFDYPSPETEVWAPITLIPESGVPRRREVRWLHVVGRLKPGISIGEARAEMEGIAARLAAEYPDSNERLTSVTMAPLRESMVGDVRPAVLTLFGAVGLVLLITCVNVAGLVLVRGEGRRMEIALRAALGASRLRVARELFAEAMLLSLLGGLLGVALAFAGLDGLVAMAPSNVPRISTVAIDGPVLGFALLLTCAVAGLLTVATQLVGPQQLSALSQSPVRGAISGGGRSYPQGLLVVAEVALVTVLAAGAGLLIQSYGRLVRVDPGMRSENLLTLGVTARTYKYPERAQYVGFFRRVLERIDSLPGVTAVGLVRPFPLRWDTFQGEDVRFTIDGRPAPPPGEAPEAAMRFTSPGYFRAMGIPLLSGRDFAPEDDEDSPSVAIVNRRAAERYWHDDDPVGNVIRIESEPPIEIIGVVGDVRQTSLAEIPEPVLYVTFTQNSRVGMTVVVRTAADPLSMSAAIQRAIWEIDPDQPITNVATMESVIRESAARPRFSMTLLALFAALALVLAALGIYGVLSYAVSRESREIGIRMALGAERRQLLRGVIGRGMRLALSGIVVGILGALAAGRLVESLLFGVRSSDPLTLLLVSLLVAASAFAASALPARRAASIDPAVALRAE